MRSGEEGLQVKSQRRAARDEGTKVPGYIVTYSDMVTLLLTFFVMLMTLAQFQDAQLYKKGRDSFLQAIGKMGIGLLVGGVEKPDFGHVKIKYFVKPSEANLKGRSIDANEELLRKLFKKVDETFETMPSEMGGLESSFSVADVHFARGEAVLDEAGKRFLTDFSLALQQSPDFEGLKLYVLGLAGKGAGAKEQWILSARRAKAAAEFLRASFPSGGQRPVYSWGAGPGDGWIGPDSAVSSQSQIMIAVLSSQ